MSFPPLSRLVKHLMRVFFATVVPALLVPFLPPLSAQDAFRPEIAAASPDAERALQSFRIPDGLTGSLVAAEPLLANPVAFTVTAAGDVYVCETFRQERGVEDNRGHSNWLENDLRLQSVEERRAMFRNVLGDAVEQYGIADDRIRLLRDTDGDGVCDTATVFADGFDDVVAGTGAGVLEHRGAVFYTCIPKLWKLIDTDGDGTADVRDPLHHGYGVRVAFRGHDLHGLVMGPDGRVYFSLGDRGYNVITKEQTRLKRVDTGAVFRCDPDGSHLEVFAYGLRNPQELAFDDDGYLFTGDNNSDGGDRARLVYVVQDGDTGWRMYYQYLNDRGPWNRERMWYPYRADELTAAVQPACIVPPVANLGDGPSGLVCYPGTGLSERYDGHFFLADFRGSSGNSGIRSFSVAPRGAGWELTDSHEFLWSILATDVDFAPDGSLLVSDWVDGWVGEGKGRIYRFASDQVEHRTAGRQVAELLAAGIAAAGDDELVALLGHRDRRVRQEAQFELVHRGSGSRFPTVIAAADDPVRVRQAVFGCWQTGLQSFAQAESAIRALEPILREDSPHAIAMQTLAVRVLSDLVERHGVTAFSSERRAALAATFTRISRTSDLRLAGFAAAALGTVGSADDSRAILDVVAADATADPVVRHQATMGLTRLAERTPGLLRSLALSVEQAVQMPVLLAMRRQHDPAITEWLNAAEGRLVDEAARAIHDEPIPGTLPALADLAGRPGLSDMALTRALNACFRLGTADRAKQVAAVGATPTVSDSTRLLAARMLRAWNAPPNLDLITGRWWPLPAREVPDLRDAVAPHLPAMLAAGDAVRDEAIAAASGLGITDVQPLLRDILADPSAGDGTRAAAFRALGQLTDDTQSLIASGRDSDVESVRVAALELLTLREPAAAVPALGQLLQDGTVAAQQRAVTLLADIATLEAQTLLAEAFRRLNAGTADAGIALELLQAAEQVAHEPLTAAADQFRQRQQQAGTPTALFSECLQGGDAERGAEVFFGRSAASCRRCHKVRGNGSDVGPDLSGVARDKDRRELLESIVDPNAKIAKGFETLIVVTVQGKILSGIVKSEVSGGA